MGRSEHEVLVILVVTVLSQYLVRDIDILNVHGLVSTENVNRVNQICVMAVMNFHQHQTQHVAAAARPYRKAVHVSNY